MKILFLVIFLFFSLLCNGQIATFKVMPLILQNEVSLEVSPKKDWSIQIGTGMKWFPVFGYGLALDTYIKPEIRWYFDNNPQKNRNFYVAAFYKKGVGKGLVEISQRIAGFSKLKFNGIGMTVGMKKRFGKRNVFEFFTGFNYKNTYTEEFYNSGQLKQYYSKEGFVFHIGLNLGWTIDENDF